MFKRSLAAFVVLLLAGSLEGCGNSLPPPPMPAKDVSKVGPHQGVALALPDDQGYVELVNEPEPEGRGDSVTTSLVAYFLDQNAKESATSVPTDVKFQVEPGSKKSRTISLKAEARSGDPSGSVRFASEPGPNRVADLRGELTATIAGKPVTVSIVGGR